MWWSQLSTLGLFCCGGGDGRASNLFGYYGDTPHDFIFIVAGRPVVNRLAHKVNIINIIKPLCFYIII